MLNTNPVYRPACVSQKQIAELFGGLVSTSPVWSDSASGVMSVNTQARRLGCLAFLIGKIGQGRAFYGWAKISYKGLVCSADPSIIRWLTGLVSVRASVAQLVRASDS